MKDRTLCVTVNMPHSHPAGWAPLEIGQFMDQHLKGGRLLPKLGATDVHEVGKGEAVVVLNVPTRWRIREVKLHCTTDLDAPWQKRQWQTIPVPQQAGTEVTDVFTAQVPKKRPIYLFLTAVDDRGATVSIEHTYLDK